MGCFNQNMHLPNRNSVEQPILRCYPKLPRWNYLEPEHLVLRVPINYCLVQLLLYGQPMCWRPNLGQSHQNLHLYGRQSLFEWILCTSSSCLHKWPNLGPKNSLMLLSCWSMVQWNLLCRHSEMCQQPNLQSSHQPMCLSSWLSFLGS